MTAYGKQYGVNKNLFTACLGIKQAESDVLQDRNTTTWMCTSLCSVVT